MHSYTEKYVGFVDILGFSEMIKKTVDSEALFSDVQDALRATASPESIGKIACSIESKRSSFSDCTIFSSPLKGDGLLQIIFDISAIYEHLLAMGFLCRGGLVKGFIIHEDDIAFGPALVEAYDIERNSAKHPRIVIERSVFNDIIAYSKKDPENNIFLDLAIEDTDGLAFIHTLHLIETCNNLKRNGNYSESIESFVDEHISIGVKIRDNIMNKLEKEMDIPEHHEKIKWLALYFNKYVSQCDQYPDSPLERILLDL